ncbi:hypothetical protein M0654_03415 [Rhizobium sp. NTR19]|uniref:Lipoprotein n=1 Tax=Neorhizobium turbinariae TaxID=2937795 RepID=A0ABT0IMC7_9HYPH|nr:hypothetical protein [Neorhizobium turbinariae]MCK8779027.1 hypothetical protein [Neorhizobium turbinariae]
MFKTSKWIIPALVMGLAGCNSPNSRVSPVSFGSSTGIVTSGNLRLVTERHKKDYPPVVCTEPSPDYMVAFDQTRSFTNTRPTEQGERKLEINLSSVEDVEKGEGREAAVLALRDGLYVACQSYANGVIGQDAYAIILSQYGNLLVALVGKDTAPGKVEVSGPNAAISAMTVACISGHDPSRDDSGRNPLLTVGFCRDLLGRVAQRGLAGAARPQVTKVTTTTTATK